MRYRSLSKFLSILLFGLLLCHTCQAAAQARVAKPDATSLGAQSFQAARLGLKPTGKTKRSLIKVRSLEGLRSQELRPGFT